METTVAALKGGQLWVSSEWRRKLCGGRAGLTLTRLGSIEVPVAIAFGPVATIFSIITVIVICKQNYIHTEGRSIQILKDWWNYLMTFYISASRSRERAAAD
jgi:hypothetical protein